MQRSKKESNNTSLYDKHREERQNYRLAQDLKKYNGLVQKLASQKTKLTRREKKRLKRLSEIIKTHSEKVPVIDNIKMAQQTSKSQLQLVTNARETRPPTAKDQSMPDLSEIFDVEDTDDDDVILTTPYQEKPLALIHETKLDKQENRVYNSILINSNNSVQTGIDITLNQNNNVITKEGQTINNLPFSCGTQTDISEELLMIHYLNSKGITTVEQLKKYIENICSETTLVDELSKLINLVKTKKITLDVPKRSIDQDDDVLFVKEEFLLVTAQDNKDKTKLHQDAIQSLVSMSTENKKMISRFYNNLVYRQVMSQYLHWKQNNNENKSNADTENDNRVDKNNENIVDKENENIVHKENENIVHKETENIVGNEKVQDNKSTKINKSTNTEQESYNNDQNIVQDASHNIEDGLNHPTENADHVEEQSETVVVENATVLPPEIAANARTTYNAASIPAPLNTRANSRNLNNKTLNVRRPKLKVPPQNEPEQQNYRNYRRRITPQVQEQVQLNYLHQNPIVVPNNTTYLNRPIARASVYQPSGQKDPNCGWNQNSHGIVYSTSSEYYGSNGTYIQNIETGHINISEPQNQYNNNYGHQNGHSGVYNTVGRYDLNRQHGAQTFGSNNILNSQNVIQNGHQGVARSNMHAGVHDGRFPNLQARHNDSWGQNGQLLSPITMANNIPTFPQQQWSSTPMANNTVATTVGNKQPTLYVTGLPHQVTSHGDIAPEWLWHSRYQ